MLLSQSFMPMDNDPVRAQEQQQQQQQPTRLGVPVAIGPALQEIYLL